MLTNLLRPMASALIAALASGRDREPLTQQPTEPEGMSGDDRPMTIVEHLEELRNRLIYSVLAIAIMTAVSFFLLTPTLMKVLILPAGNIELIYTEVTEGFGTYIKVALFAGAALSMPVLVYQLILFIAPALTRQEKRLLYLALPPIFLFFLVGVAFGYFVLVPPAVKFLISFGTEFAKPTIKISNYIGVVTRLLFWIGVVFETPVIMFALARFRIVTTRQFASFRRYAIVIAFVLAAVITPTFDPVNQTLVAVPLIVLYELGILLARLA